VKSRRTQWAPRQFSPRSSRGAPRDWAFWVQVSGLVGFWMFVATIWGWFGYRTLELLRLGDVWQPAIVLGVVVSTLFVVYASVLTYLFVRLGAAADGPAPDLPIDSIEEKLTEGVLKPWSWRYKLTVGILAGLFAWALYCWYREVHEGLGVTGLGRPIFWGLFITDFVFFIGISHAGTLVSAILRLAQAEWRRAITRSAEAITVLVLFFGAWSILLDLGRIDRILNVFESGRMESPLLWDVCSITTYLFGSTIYLYLPLIPDLALLRRRVTGIRKPLYHLMSFGWTGTEKQKHALERAIGVMAVVVLPVAVSVHTVVSWVFSMTIQPLWHSTVFGPYFVAGAIFSGIAALLIAMAIVRRFMGLERFLKPVHFNYLGMLLFVMTCLWGYFTTCEFLTAFYGDEPTERHILHEKLVGGFAPLIWTMVVCCFVIPIAILARKKTRSVTGCVVASCTILVGMWIERYTIVVPTLQRPRLEEYASASYFPTFLEWSLLVGACAGFCLLYVLFARLFPIISIWEVREGREEAPEQVAERVRDYFPTAEEPAAVGLRRPSAEKTAGIGARR